MVKRMGEIRKEIEKQLAKYREYIQKGDTAGLESLYTEDACVMPPNSEMITGKEGIKMFAQRFISSGVKDIKLTTIELVGEGDTFTERGEAWLKFQPEGQEAMEDKGKYIILWKKTPEGWKLRWDIFNTNLPAP